MCAFPLLTTFEGGREGLEENQLQIDFPGRRIVKNGLRRSIYDYSKVS